MHEYKKDFDLDVQILKLMLGGLEPEQFPTPEGLVRYKGKDFSPTSQIEDAVLAVEVLTKSELPKLRFFLLEVEALMNNGSETGRHLLLLIFCRSILTVFSKNDTQPVEGDPHVRV